MAEREGFEPSVDFKKAIESQKAFAAPAGRWQADTVVDYKIALNHFFPAKKG